MSSETSFCGIANCSKTPLMQCSNDNFQARKTTKPGSHKALSAHLNHQTDENLPHLSSTGNVQFKKLLAYIVRASLQTSM